VRLTVIIPAFNECESIGEVLARLPKNLPDGINVEPVVVDDGSTDGTGARATAAGAQVVKHPERRGLAAAFRTGLGAALLNRADLIATLDADGQYRPEELSLLFAALRKTGADLVVGDRQVSNCPHMPPGNRIGNVVGSAMLRLLAGITVNDASSGFRLFTARLARVLQITSRHTYTHEMLIQTKAYGFRVTQVPVTFLPRRYGRSKLVRTLRHHIMRSCGTILRALFLFRPLRKFLLLALGSLVLAAVCGGWVIFSPGSSRPFLTILSLVLILVALQFVVLGVIADSFAAERRIVSERPLRAIQ
jgi:glycosyltransferase involved in cell wall biosynthesis